MGYKARAEHSKKEVLREAMDPTPYVPQVLEVWQSRRLKSLGPEKSYSSVATPAMEKESLTLISALVGMVHSKMRRKMFDKAL